MSNLRQKLIRLAHANPKVRPHLLPLLASDKTAGGGSWLRVFDTLDTKFGRKDPYNVTPWNKVLKQFQGVTNDAGAATHYYSEYRAGRMSKEDAVRELNREGVKAPFI